MSPIHIVAPMAANNPVESLPCTVSPKSARKDLMDSPDEMHDEMTELVNDS